ncbi:hypothetical protein F5884DRAFT_804769 [Xylogone sp. PMI_703]|nr:hypothetical protein F5884DRAFT_804769 [Xylogone sp. PMI_703]
MALLFLRSGIRTGVETLILFLLTIFCCSPLSSKQPQQQPEANLIVFYIFLGVRVIKRNSIPRGGNLFLWERGREKQVYIGSLHHKKKRGKSGCRSYTTGLCFCVWMFCPFCFGPNFPGIFRASIGPF